METFQLPPRKSLAEFLETCTSKGGKDGVFAAKTDRPPAKKGKCWTEEEHLAFLAGLRKYGKGSWKSISRFYVPTRTSTQIASHAQKYLQRMTGPTKRKSKFTEIEQQVQNSRLSDISQPSWPLPEKQDAAEVRSCSEGPPSPSPTAEAAIEQPAKRQRVCRPTAIRATSSEPDLVKLAESLVSLADVSRNLSPSDTSAFKRANSASPQPGSSLYKARGAHKQMLQHAIVWEDKLRR